MKGVRQKNQINLPIDQRGYVVSVAFNKCAIQLFAFCEAGPGGVKEFAVNIDCNDVAGELRNLQSEPAA
jgi:hypothetical protein